MTLDNEKFSGVSSINDYLLISNLENNLQSFLDWGFLNIGGFINVNNTATSYSNSPNKLAIVDDPNYATGQVWQTRFNNWVWESDIIFGESSPTQIGSVVVNGTTASSSSYTLDYLNSRVIFDTAIRSNSTVTMNYSYKFAQIHKLSDNLVWWKQFQSDVANETAQFNNNTGDYAIFSQHRVQLPCIIIQTVPRGESEPYQLGDKSLRTYQDIILHIITSNIGHRNSIIDIIRLQEDKVIWLYNTSTIISANVLPFNFNGSLNSNRLNYGQIINHNDYRWKTCHLQNFIISEVESRYYFHEAKIRLTAEIIFSPIPI
jgi:hypothetical protein